MERPVQPNQVLNRRRSRGLGILPSLADGNLSARAVGRRCQAYARDPAANCTQVHFAVIAVPVRGQHDYSPAGLQRAASLQLR